MVDEQSPVRKLYIRAFLIFNIEILLFSFFAFDAENSSYVFFAIGFLLSIIYGIYSLIAPLKRITYNSNSIPIHSSRLSDQDIEKTKEAFEKATSTTGLEKTELRILPTDEHESWYPNAFKLPFSGPKSLLHPDLPEKYSEQELQILFERSLWQVKEGTLNHQYIWRVLPIFAVGIPLSFVFPTIPADYIILTIIFTIPLSHFYGNYRKLQSRLQIEQRLLNKYSTKTITQLDDKHNLGIEINYDNLSLRDYGLFFLYPHIFHPKLNELKNTD